MSIKNTAALLLVMLLTSCTSLSYLERVVLIHAVNAIPERQVNNSLTEDEQLEEGGELLPQPLL